jgi:putative ABC transport system permease protein
VPEPGWASRACTALIRLLFRRRDEDEVHDVVADAQALLAEARQRGPVKHGAVWVMLAWDAATGALRQDLVDTVRALLRTPRFTLAAAALLGIGVAVTTTLFALLNAAFFRPLPFVDADRLVMIWETSPEVSKAGPAPGNVISWRARATGIETLTAWMTTRATLWRDDTSHAVTGAQVTAGFFDVFRTLPLLGRTFRESEYRDAQRLSSAAPGSPVVIGHALWLQLGAPQDIIGRELRIDSSPSRVIGVMPPQFSTPHSEAAFWTPWDMHTSYRGARFPAGPPREARFLNVAGRLESGITLEAAAARLAGVAEDLSREYPDTNAGWSVRIVPLAVEFGSGRPQLLLLFASVVCLLTLVCANFAGMSLTRALAKSRELAIRTALGAGRSRLVRHLASEALMLAGISTVIGLLLTAWWLDAAVALAPEGLPRLNDVTLDWRVVLFAGAAACFVGIVAGLVPIVAGTSPDIAGTLRDGSRGSSGRAAAAWRLLVVGELAMTLGLLIVAGLLVRSFDRLSHVDLGFDPTNVLVLRVSPDQTRYRSSEQTLGYYARLLEELRAVPGVVSAAAVTSLPLSGVGADFDRPFWPQVASRPRRDVPRADIRMATPGYFATLRRRLLEGREFLEGDTSESANVVIVNDALVTSSMSGLEPIGQTLMIDYLGGVYPYRVIGVVADARHDGPHAGVRPEIFIPHAQNPYLFMNVVARTRVDPTLVLPVARTAAQRVDPGQPLHSLTTMENLAGAAVEQDRASTMLVLIFAVAGALVAFTGVYALCSATVAAQHREIAVMMAIGASRARVRTLIVARACRLAAAGAAIGIVAGLLAGRAIATLLVGVSAHDPRTLTLTTALLFVLVLAATWPAADRAARTDPMTALRS